MRKPYVGFPKGHELIKHWPRPCRKHCGGELGTISHHNWQRVHLRSMPNRKHFIFPKPRTIASRILSPLKSQPPRDQTLDLGTKKTTCTSFWWRPTSRKLVTTEGKVMKFEVASQPFSTLNCSTCILVFILYWSHLLPNVHSWHSATPLAPPPHCSACCWACQVLPGAFASIHFHCQVVNLFRITILSIKSALKNGHLYNVINWLNKRSST